MIIEIDYHFQSNNQFSQRSFQLHLKNALVITETKTAVFCYHQA